MLSVPGEGSWLAERRPSARPSSVGSAGQTWQKELLGTPKAPMVDGMCLDFHPSMTHPSGGEAMSPKGQQMLG